MSTILNFSPAGSLSLDQGALASFKNLSQVVFGSLATGNGYAWIDNIAVTPVPEPAHALMFISAWA